MPELTVMLFCGLTTGRRPTPRSAAVETMPHAMSASAAATWRAGPMVPAHTMTTDPAPHTTQVTRALNRLIQEKTSSAAPVAAHSQCTVAAETGRPAVWPAR